MMQKKITTAMRTRENNVNVSMLFSVSIAFMIMGILLALIVALRKADSMYMIVAAVFAVIGVFMLAFAMREEKLWTIL